jgi:hypothetical protein
MRKILSICVSLIFAAALVGAPNTPPSQPKLSAAEIVDKNVAARGGLQAWRGVQTLSFTGKMGAGGNQRAPLAIPSPGGKAAVQAPRRPAEETQLPFEMDLARPHKVRFELQFNGKTAVQTYDGVNGWKLRPFLNRTDAEPFTPDELKTASRSADLDGPLVDCAAKGTQVELDGVEKVNDRDTYKLKLTLKNGDVTHVWVDAQTFLETKAEGTPRRLDGTYHKVEVYYRDYRAVDGLQIPYVLETRVLPVAKTAAGFRDTPVPPEKIVIDKVVVNPKLDASRFSKPQIAAAPATANQPATKPATKR